MTLSATTTSHNKRPIISVCVPTYNRATCLENLMKNLAQLRTAHGTDLEICVSNNQSTDGTSQVIESWRARLELKVVTQSENIGATRNGIAVTQAATGQWLLIIGDDDELIPGNFAKLLAHLQSADEDDWILAGVADAPGKEHLLGALVPGRYGAKSFRRIALRTGLHRFGFIGKHIFPSVLQPEFAGLSPGQAQPWPHLALFLRHLQSGHFQVFPVPIVGHSAGGAELFWHLGDLVHIYLRQLNIIAEARAVLEDLRWFFDALLLRELYSSRNAKTLVLWKALEPREFHRKAFREYIVRYTLLGPLTFLAALHCMFLLVIHVTPSGVMRVMLRLAGKGNVIARHIAEKQAKGRFDGVKRGL